MDLIVKKGLIKFNYEKKYHKFTFAVLKKEIMVVLTRDLAFFLGFQYYQIFFSGSTIWAKSGFHHTFFFYLFSNSKIYFVHIQNMQTETYPLKSADLPCKIFRHSTVPKSSTCLFYDVPYTVDKSKLSKRAKESLPTDLTISLEFKICGKDVRILKNGELIWKQKSC